MQDQRRVSLGTYARIYVVKTSQQRLMVSRTVDHGLISRTLCMYLSIVAIEGNLGVSIRSANEKLQSIMAYSVL